MSNYTEEPFIRNHLDLEAEAMIAAIDRVQAVIEFDTEGRILRANRNFLETTGYELAEIQGKHHRIFCAPEYSQTAEYREFWQKLAQGNFDSGVYRRRAKGGRDFWIQASYNPVFGAEGRVVKVVKFATDITAQRLRDADHLGKIRAIDRSQAMVEFDLEGNVLAANDNFLHLLGYTLREIKGRHHQTFCEPELVKTPAYAQFWARLAKGEFQHGRYKRLGKFKQPIWIQASYNPVFEEDGRMLKIVKIATDITETVKREEELQHRTCSMSESLTQLLQSIEEISQGTSEASSVASATAASAGDGRRSVHEVVNAVTEMRRATHDIESIASVIGDLSAQTNLLAFNAAIEAARAGEHGLGFSVVAEEVRRLAEKSAQAAAEISKLIRTSVERAERGLALSNETVKAFDSIAESAQRTHSSIQNIDRATDQQSRAAREVSSAVEELKQASRTALKDADNHGLS